MFPAEVLNLEFSISFQANRYTVWFIQVSSIAILVLQPDVETFPSHNFDLYFYTFTTEYAMGNMLRFPGFWFVFFPWE